jgi:hypothetical protein
MKKISLFFPLVFVGSGIQNNGRIRIQNKNSGYATLDYTVGNGFLTLLKAIM